MSDITRDDLDRMGKMVEKQLKDSGVDVGHVNCVINNEQTPFELKLRTAQGLLEGTFFDLARLTDPEPAELARFCDCNKRMFSSLVFSIQNPLQLTMAISSMMEILMDRLGVVEPEIHTPLKDDVQ